MGCFRAKLRGWSPPKLNTFCNLTSSFSAIFVRILITWFVFTAAKFSIYKDDEEDLCPGCSMPHIVQYSHRSSNWKTVGNCWCEIFTGQMPFLSPNQQCESIKGTALIHTHNQRTDHAHISISTGTQSRHWLVRKMLDTLPGK